jgi:hypothetical protein
MIIRHHCHFLPLEDSWLVAAKAATFVPTRSAYVVDSTHCNERYLGLIDIDDIGPVLRAPSVPYFHGSVEEGITAEERVVRILRAFATEAALPPVEIVKTPNGRYPFKLTDGTHRLYLSLAVGFTRVPANEGFDFECG